MPPCSRAVDRADPGRPPRLHHLRAVREQPAPAQRAPSQLALARAAQQPGTAAPRGRTLGRPRARIRCARSSETGGPRPAGLHGRGLGRRCQPGRRPGRRVLRTLHNPRYAGAFAYGRRKTVRAANGKPAGRPRQRGRPAAPRARAARQPPSRARAPPLLLSGPRQQARRRHPGSRLERRAAPAPNRPRRLPAPAPRHSRRSATSASSASVSSPPTSPSCGQTPRPRNANASASRGC